MTELLSCILCLLLAWTLVQGLLSIARGNKTSPRKLLPGPIPFPIVGNLFELGSNPHKSLAQLAKTHGPIMSLRLGHITTIVISSATMAREVLQKHDLSFSNRFVPDALRAQKHNQVSVAWLPVSTQWRNLRKICNSHIFTSRKLDANESLRRCKVQDLLRNVQERCQAGEAINIGQAAFTTVLNLLSNTILSVDFTDPNSDGAREFMEVVLSIMEEAGKPNFVDYFPVLRKMDPQGIRRRLTAHFETIIRLFDGIIEQRLQLRKEHGFLISNDMLDTLLSICEDNSGEIDRTHLKHLLLDLFAAGTDTSSSTLEWAMAEVLRNPETLMKAKVELQQTIGKGNPLQEADIARLPYLQAIVKETFRLHPAIPFLLPRKVEADIELWGYEIPKGAQVLVNAWAIGRDPSTWTNPNSFVPERFLGSDINVKGRDFELIPFGAGRRICPGLPMAIRMVHLMLGSLIHSFDWKLEDGVTPEDMDMEDKFGLTLQKAHPLLPANFHQDPIPFPLVGNLIEIGNKPHKSLAELAKTHGPIMSLRLGHITTIVISSATVATEVLQKQDLSFSNRFITDAIRAHEHNQVSQKVQDLLQDVQESCRANRAIDISRAAFKTSLNFLSNTLFSVDFADPSSDRAREFKEVAWSIMEEVGKPNLVDYFPMLTKIDPQGIRRRLTAHFGKIIRVFDCMIDQRLHLRKENGFITKGDMLDTLLSISEEKSGEFDKTDIEHLLLDLFVAGTETTSSTLE
ncbi:hypothetical protein L1049_007179 [Liquidambar formosana]|uniref:Cytochrome P450 n=1 Tax=Liquidambar formosana TaxID=63359 RepID=A0AAP0RID9_LIQFO